MSEDVLGFSETEFQWSASGTLTEGFQVALCLDTTDDGKGTGPWTVVADEPPSSGGTGTGPSPVNLALGALAACTAVTVAGVARRRKMDLRSLRVEVAANKVLASKQAAEELAAAGGSGARRRAVKRVVVSGALSDEDLEILGRASRHCPVGRLFEGGWLAFEEEITLKLEPKDADS